MVYSGNKIAYFRKRGGFTQNDIREEVFRRTGKKFRQGTISSWENGKTAPDMDILMVLASILNVNVDDLYDKPHADSPESTSADLIRFEDGLHEARQLFSERRLDEAYHKLESLYSEMLKSMSGLSGSYEKLQAQMRAVREITRL